MPISKVRVLFQRNNVVIYISCTPLQLYYFLITKWSKTKMSIKKKITASCNLNFCMVKNLEIAILLKIKILPL